MISARSTYAGIVDHERAALAAGEVLGFVKALGCACSRTFPGAGPGIGQKAVRVVLHHRDTMTPAIAHNRVHLAADAGIVNRHDRFGLGRDCALEQRLIQIQRIGTNIDEDRPGPAEKECVDGGDEGERGNDLVPGPMFSSSAAISRACVQEVVSSALGTPILLQKSLALPGEGAVARGMHLVDRLLDIPEFGAHRAQAIKGYETHGLQ